MNVCERGGRVSAMRSVWMAESDAGARQRRSLFVCVLLFEFAEDDAVGVGGREREWAEICWLTMQLLLHLTRDFAAPVGGWSDQICCVNEGRVIALACTPTDGRAAAAGGRCN